MSAPIAISNYSPWPHRLAVVLVCATFPLIWVGGLVTTFDAGMAVPDWPTTFGYNMFAYPLEKWLNGSWNVFIEHFHRLLGSMVGLLTIAFMVAALCCDNRRYVKQLSVAALVLVIVQGVLGGMRVIENERVLAAVHGCVGPAFFALTVALAVITSRRWYELRPVKHEKALDLQRLALTTAVLAYVQLVLGAHVRHFNVGFDANIFRVAIIFHVLVACVLFVQALLTARCGWRFRRENGALFRPALMLGVQLTVQVLLGVGAWVTNYGWPGFLQNYDWGYRLTGGHVTMASGPLQAVTTTAHVAIGSLIVVTALMLTLRSFRFLDRLPRTAGMVAASASPRVEGIAG